MPSRAAAALPRPRARLRRRALCATVLFIASVIGAPPARAVSSTPPLPAPRPAPPEPPGAPAGVPGPDVPLPVPRPEEAGPRLPDVRAREGFGPAPLPRPADPLAPPEPDGTCEPLLASGKVAARRAAPIPGQDGCGIAAPVTLDAVVLRTGQRVALSPPAVMRCDFADRLADWLRDDVAPATGAAGALVAIDDAAAYTCRHRNWQANGRISEHARGNAIDLLAFHFAGHIVGLKGPGDAAVLEVLRTTACLRFSTVLGPGSDAFHDTDLHLDLQRRRNGFKLCQWTVP